MEQKLYYKIKDVSEFLGETPSTLRYWETEFAELRPKRSTHSQRQYTPKDLETLRVIQYLLRTRGMHISMAKEQLRTNRNNLARRTKAIEKLEEVRESLGMLLKSLNKIRT